MYLTIHQSTLEIFLLNIGAFFLIINFNSFSGQNCSTSTSHKPFLGSCELPPKFWTQLVQPFLRLLDTNTQTNKQSIYSCLLIIKKFKRFLNYISPSACFSFKFSNIFRFTILELMHVNPFIVCSSILEDTQMLLRSDILLMIF